MNSRDLEKFGFGNFAGLKVFESPFMVEDGEPYLAKRGWRERFFSLPWRPLMRLKTVIPKVPMRTALQLENGSIIVHPAIAAEYRKAVDAIQGGPLNE